MYEARMTDSILLPMVPERFCAEEFELELKEFALHPVHHVPTYQFRMVHLLNAGRDRQHPS
jgi:hypothetical protein